MAGPVPARVDGGVKAGLLELVDHGVERGWEHQRACELLQVEDERVRWWRCRGERGESLRDATPGPVEPVHALLPWEREAVLKLAEQWGEVGRGHRKLAHRGCRLGVVPVSESTVLRILREEGIILPQRPVRDPAPRLPWPDWLVWQPNRLWCYDFTHFTRAKRCAIVVLEVVSRKWLATVVSAEETSTQVEVVFLDALAGEGFDALLDARLRHHLADPTSTMGDIEYVAGQDSRPVLIGMSDNGPQMRSHDTRAFMAACAIMQKFARSGTPTDQAWIESLFGHVKTEWPHLEQIRDPGELEAELEHIRRDYNSIRLHAGIGYVTPDDEHSGRGEAIR
jgi:transposase InsO family protein